MLVFNHALFIKIIGRVLFLIFAWLVSANLYAGNISINPVKVSISQDNPIQTLTLTNKGEDDAVVQADVMLWTQQDGKDSHQESPDLLVSPPIFTIKSGASQLVRVGLRGVVDPEQEKAYRLFLQEIPPPRKDGGSGLQIALRFSVPVFVLPKQTAMPDLHWQLSRVDNNHLRIDVQNTGTAHEHISAIQLYQHKQTQPWLNEKVFAYLLPGASHHWLMEVNGQMPVGKTVNLQARSKHGDINAEILLTTP